LYNWQFCRNRARHKLIKKLYSVHSTNYRSLKNTFVCRLRFPLFLNYLLFFSLSTLILDISLVSSNKPYQSVRPRWFFSICFFPRQSGQNKNIYVVSFNIFPFWTKQINDWNRNYNINQRKILRHDSNIFVWSLCHGKQQIMTNLRGFTLR